MMHEIWIHDLLKFARKTKNCEIFSSSIKSTKEHLCQISCQSVASSRKWENKFADFGIENLNYLWNANCTSCLVIPKCRIHKLTYYVSLKIVFNSISKIKIYKNPFNRQCFPVLDKSCCFVPVLL